MANNTGRDQFTFEIREHIGVLSTNSNREQPWTKEVNIVSWNGGIPKVDIREWSPDHERMSRGITLPETEAKELAKVLTARYVAIR